MIYCESFPSPVGTITVKADEEYLLNVEFGGCDTERSNKITTLAKEEIGLYFDGKLKEFTVPYRLSGTEFQLKVWNALTEIPYGETASYEDIAVRIGNPKACRAVGMANNKNRLPIIIPCHRVIGKNGSLTGYAGGTAIKKILLETEKRNSL